MIVIDVVLLTGIVFVLLLYVGYRIIFVYPMNKRPNPREIPASLLYKKYRDDMLLVVDDMEKSPFEVIEKTSYEGYSLRARLYGRTKENKPVVLFMHGYHGTAEWDGYGMYRICKKLGWPILMPDMRAHGKSEGSISFGIRERHDVRTWLEYLEQRFGEETDIILAGVSMGGTSVLLAASDYELPSNVKGIISDCAFSHPAGLFSPVFQKIHFPAKLLFRFMKLSARVFGKFDLEEVSANGIVGNIKVPILFIHGTEDFIVPVCMCHELYDKCTATKKKVVFEGASHANSAMTDYEKYEENVVSFLNVIK